MRLYVPQSTEENMGIASWAASGLDVVFCEPYIAMASIDHRGEIIGAVVLNNYDGGNIDISGVGIGAFTPSVVRSLARYVFNQLGCARVTLKTRRSNYAARKLLSRHFKYEATLKSWYGNEDAFQFRMLRDECKWLGDNHGKHSHAPRAA